ncbi:flavocytochrome c [Cellulosilyticum ruminicola]|uniref:flavocytochrome c n=1 Tax=Cellulosilyticum ruminicola TaxID=425254 RepID=UPI0009FA448C|nr:flavocytochrome c [Cellulosilyticum ruminicola]
MRINKLLATIACVAVVASSFVGCGNTTQSANATTQETQTGETSASVITLNTDIVVIGAGGGGLSAAIEAHDAGANVIIVEKMPFVGGNTARATGGINAAGTVFQEKLGITDTPEIHYADTLAGGENLNDPELVKYLTENAKNAINWLTDLGADLSDVGSLGGATNKRAHRPAGGAAVGNHLVEVLSANVAERGIETMKNTEATELIVSGDEIIGIKAKSGNQEYIINADAVVIASGGFANNAEIYTKYVPELDGFISTNQVGATGDGIKLAESVKADFVDLEEIQIHPTVHPETAGLITEAVRGNGAILVNNKGERFTNEMLTRDKVSAAILEQEGGHAYLVFDQSVRESLAAIEKYVSQGITTEAETPEALAEALGMDASTLKATITKYNEAVTSGNDTAFGRNAGLETTFEKAPYYAIEVAPGVHHTMGGIKINTNSEVISSEGSVIKNLYAAGEVTGGVHGAERLGGNALADIIVFGRQAGINASALAMSDGKYIGITETAKIEEIKEKIKADAIAQYVDGTYPGESKGNNGTVKVEVIIKDGFIDAIDVIEQHETSTIFASIQNELIPSIIYNQSTESVDAISGASKSSAAILEAVTNALSTATK